MSRIRVLSRAVMFMVPGMVVVLASCSPGDQKPNLSSAGPGMSTVSAATSGSTPRSPSGSTGGSASGASSAVTSTSSGPAVPIDQIPPGNPASWVPAGVPTTAPYREAGDVVPMFTRAMFGNTQAGALATAKYYLDARNWAYATMSATPFLVICDAAKCKTETSFYATGVHDGQHVVGARWSSGPVSLIASPKLSSGQSVVQTAITVGVGTLLGSDGKAIRSERGSSNITNLYLRWSGSMWRISAELLVN
jgi:hypothetical protein